MRRYGSLININLSVFQWQSSKVFYSFYVTFSNGGSKMAIGDKNFVQLILLLFLLKTLNILFSMDTITSPANFTDLLK